MIDVMLDVNAFLNACRFRDTFAEAIENTNDTMKVLLVIANLGERSGVRVHTGEHILSNIEGALAEKEESNRGTTTRNAWVAEDIEFFVSFVHRLVQATGGQADCGTITHGAARGQFAAKGAPDAEDLQMLVLAAQSAATMLITNDNAVLQMGEFEGVEICPPEVLFAEVRANRRRHCQ